MKQKSYGIATPSFISSNKGYSVRAFLHDLKTKVYGLRLNVVTPFLNNEKDYPVKLSASSRLPGIVDEDVSKVAERIRTVDTVLSKFAVGLLERDEKGAIIDEFLSVYRPDTWLSLITESKIFSLDKTLDTDIIASIDFTEKEINFIIDIIKSEPAAVRDEWSIEILENYKSIISKEFTVNLNPSFVATGEQSEYSADVLEDEQALKLIKLIHGSNYVDYIKSELKHKELQVKFLKEETAKIVIKVIEGRFEEFSEFEGIGFPTYLPELITAFRNREEVSALFEDYTMVDFLFSPIESRMFDIEFYNRKQDIMPDGVMFNDYDFGVHNMTYESNGFHQHFDLADRAVEVLEGRFYFTEEGMRQKYLKPVDEVRFLPEIDESVRVQLELTVTNLEYDHAIKPTVVDVDFLYHYDLAYRIQDKMSTGKLDDEFELVEHNMSYDGTFDHGYDTGVHNMQYESQFYEWFDHGVQAMNEGRFYEWYELATGGKTVQAKFEEFDDFVGIGWDTYLPHLEFASRSVEQVSSPLDDFANVNRLDLYESREFEGFSQFNRNDEWFGTYYEGTDSSRLNTFGTFIDEFGLDTRLNTFETSINEFHNLDRIDTFRSEITLLDESFRDNEWNAAQNIIQTVSSDRVSTFDMEQIIEQIETVNRNRYTDKMMDIIGAFDFTLIKETYAGTVETIDIASIIDEFGMEIISSVESTLVNNPYIVDIQEAFDFTLRTMVKEGRFLEFTDFYSNGRPVYMHESDAFGLVKDDYEARYVDIDESIRPDVFDMQYIEQFTLDLVKNDYYAFEGYTEMNEFTGIRPTFDSMFVLESDVARRVDLFEFRNIELFDFFLDVSTFDLTLQEIDSSYVRDVFDMRIIVEQLGEVIRPILDSRQLLLDEVHQRLNTWSMEIDTTQQSIEKDIFYASDIATIDRMLGLRNEVDVSIFELTEIDRTANLYGYGTDISHFVETQERLTDYATSIEELQTVEGRINLRDMVLEEFDDFRMGAYDTSLAEFDLFNISREYGMDISQFDSFSKDNLFEDALLADFQMVGRSNEFELDITETTSALYGSREKSVEILELQQVSVLDEFSASISELLNANREDTFISLITSMFDSRRQDDFVTYIYQDVMASRIDEFVANQFDESAHARRVDEFITSVQSFQDSYRVDEFVTDISTFMNVRRSDEILTEIETLQDVTLGNDYTGIILESVLTDKKSDFETSINESQLSRRDDTWYTDIDSFLGVTRQSVKEGTQYETVMGNKMPYPLELVEYDLFDRIDEFATSIIEDIHAGRVDVGAVIENFTDVNRADVHLSDVLEFLSVERADEFITSIQEFESSYRVDIKDVILDGVFDSTKKTVYEGRFYDFEQGTRVDEFTSSLQEHFEFTRLTENIAVSLNGFTDGKRADEFVTAISSITDGNRVDAFDTNVETYFDSSRVDTFVTDLDETDVLTRVDTFATELQEQFLFTREKMFLTTSDEYSQSDKSGKDGTIIEIEDGTKYSDFATEIITSFLGGKASDYLTDIITTDEFGKHTDYSTVIDTLVQVALGNDYTGYIEETFLVHDRFSRMSEVIESFDFTREYIFEDAVLGEIESADTVALPSQLLEGDMGEMKHIYNMDISSEIDLFTREDILNVHLEEFLKVSKFSDYNSSITELFNGDMASDYMTEIIELFDASKQSHFNTIIEVTEYATKSSDFRTVIDETWYASTSREFFATDETIEEASTRAKLSDLDDGFSLADRVHDWVTEIGSLDEMSRAILEMGPIIETDVFGRTVKDLAPIVEIDWFSRTVKDLAPIIEFGQFTRTVKDLAPIVEFDFFGRTIQDIDIVEEFASARRLEEFLIDIIESDGFWGPPPDRYEWLWHSRPYAWYTWNWYKTK
jgi:hypothetical protein